jgi:ubiquinone/menaquinone biosynthesis C-methylase UbiE
MRNVPAEEPSHIPRYRRYYEHLSRAYQEIVSTRRHSPTLAYLDSFKEAIYYPLVLFHLPAGEPRVLDLGCGPGKDLLAIADRRPIRGCGVDFALNNLRLAQERGQSAAKTIHWVLSSVECLPFSDHAFECAFFSEVLEHLLEPDLALREIRRILKPSGLLFLTTPNRFSYFSMISEILPQGLKSTLKRWVWNMPRDYQVSRHYLDDPEVKRHVREFSPGELRQILEKNSFRVLSLRGGALAVPIPSLFDRWSWLLAGWKRLDKMISHLPGSACLKENLIALAIKEGA